jgi:ribosomal protein S6
MDQEENTKKEYELAFLVNEETDAPGIVAALKAAGAEIQLEGPVRKIALAYEIKKQASANFGFVQFMMEPAAAKSLESSLALRPEVLRFMLITPPSAKAQPYPQSAAPQRPAAAKPYEPKAAPALSNEALEKKIEEILK